VEKAKLKKLLNFIEKRHVTTLLGMAKRASQKLAPFARV
jgi:hypothetical protein